MADQIENRGYATGNCFRLIHERRRNEAGDNLGFNDSYFFEMWRGLNPLTGPAMEDHILKDVLAEPLLLSRPQLGRRRRR